MAFKTFLSKYFNPSPNEKDVLEKVIPNESIIVDEKGLMELIGIAFENILNNKSDNEFHYFSCVDYRNKFLQQLSRIVHIEEQQMYENMSELSKNTINSVINTEEFIDKIVERIKKNT